MVQLIAIDIDGTLLESNLSISQTNKSAITKALDKGVQIVLCTGRPTPAAIASTKELGLYGKDGFLITYHGAVTSRLKDMSRSHTFPLVKADIQDLFDFAQSHQVHAYAIDDQKMVSLSEDTTELARRESDLMQVPIVVTNHSQVEGADKFMLMDDPALLTEVEAKLPKDLTDRFTILRSVPYFLEFIHKDSDKRAATAHLAQELGIPLEEVMGIGDGGNDIHLVETCGIGVAMGNAVSEVKEKADYITATNDHDGVALAIEKFVLS